MKPYDIDGNVIEMGDLIAICAGEPTNDIHVTKIKDMNSSIGYILYRWIDDETNRQRVQSVFETEDDCYITTLMEFKLSDCCVKIIEKHK